MSLFDKIKYAVGTMLLMVYLFWQRVWFSLLPIISPVIDIANTIKPDVVSPCGLLEQATKTVLLGVLLWYKAMMAVLDIVTWPFQTCVYRAKQFFFQLEVDYKTKGMTTLDREAWLTKQLMAEKEKREEKAAEEINKDGNH